VAAVSAASQAGSALLPEILAELRAGRRIAFAYDNLNRLATKTPPAPMPIVTYAYDLAGRVTQRRGKVRESLCRFLLAGTCSENEAVDPLLPGTC